VLPFAGVSPRIHSSAYLAPGSVIVGDVEIGEMAAIWFHAVIRGDVSKIVIGENTNIQDGCVLHGQLDEFDVRVGNNVTVGHQAIIHGSVVEDDVLIGMGARVLNGCTIGTGSIVAAGAVLREGTAVPPGTLVAGVPARVRRDVKAEERQMIHSSALHYIDYAASYRAELEEG
jgi:carbonic anhydrase/acetyltransferase-like protein (isoleucine patch superfamily)